MDLDKMLSIINKQNETIEYLRNEMNELSQKVKKLEKESLNFNVLNKHLKNYHSDAYNRCDGY